MNQDLSFLEKQNNSRSVLKKFGKIKTVPAVVTRLMEMTKDDSATFDAFEAVIKYDPTLVVKILKLVNSPYYALHTKIKSISEALAFLGVEKLRNLIVLDALKNVFAEGSQDKLFSRKKLWLHCVAVSICSQMIMERIFEKKGEDAFLCGILHDFGFIVLDQAVPGLFKELCETFDVEKHEITKHEQLITGTDHSITGYLLSEEWGMPSEVREGIKDHHNIISINQPDSLAAITQISEFMCQRLNYNFFPEVKTELAQPLLIHLRDNINEYRAITDDLPSEFKKAEVIYKLEED
ncbi:MAG: HDOD domain-containing protein [Thermodesulfobacteriota bacterium]